MHRSKPIFQSNFLIVSGNGRNVGKTSFICAIISSASEDHSITAIKVSPHFHTVDHKDAIFQNEHFVIRKEMDVDGTKDSARMLRAGAKDVYYIEVEDDHLEAAILELQKHADLQGPVICESGGMRSIFKPSLFFVVNRPDRSDQKASFIKLVPLADKIILFDGKDFNFPPEDIFFDNSAWKIK
jgi:hypothetical protein